MNEKTPVPVSGWMGSNSRWSLLHVTACQIAIAAVVALMPTTSLALPPTAIQAYPASDDGTWTMVGKAHDPGRKAGPRKNSIHEVDENRLRQQLQKAPFESLQNASGAVIAVPMPDGSFARVALKESPIFSPELQARYSEIRTYHGVGVDDPSIQGRLDFTPAGFHAMLFTDDGVVFVDPAQRGDTSRYISYWKADVAGKAFTCDVHGVTPSEFLPKLFPANNPSGTQLRTYRLAVSVTGEYTQLFGGAAGAAAQIATTVNRVTGIYEREVAIRLNLVATRIFTDSATDPFPQAACDLRSENQAELDANVGNANYDVGHVFSAGGSGGVASGGSVCVTGSKARGCTSLGNPSGDAFDVDFVAHEIGHQFGGNHTWSGSSCGPAGQFIASAAYEPGSGTTIMGYAGVCAGGGANGQNIAANSDPFFHTRSFDEILAFRTTGSGASCGTTAPTGNNAPTVEAGLDCTIPRSTPFTLTAQGDEPNADAMTFSWEQYDAAGTWVAGMPSATATSGPLFRFRPPTTSPSRTFPRFQDILSGAATPWEVLPAVDRTLNFRVVARDNRAGGGGVDWDAMRVTVSGSPFEIVAPAQGAQLECGDLSTFTWNVGGGSVAPNVNIQTSTDGGASFSTLVAGTANDGSAQVTVPKVLTGTGRVMLTPTTQCFFAVSRNFSIADTKVPLLGAPSNVLAECTSPLGTPVSLGFATASDLCDASPAVTNDAPAVFALGIRTVTWTARDASSNQSTATQLVNIQDTVAPSITAPPDITAECTSPTGTPVALGTPVVSDTCDASPAVTNDAPAAFPLGIRTVIWTASDASSNQGTSAQTVNVEDTTAPTVLASLGETMLWPANHIFTNVRLGASVSEACDSNPAIEVKVFGNEDDETPTGDGNFSPDASAIALNSLRLRSERKGDGDGRVYLVVVRATDASGNAGIDCVTVVVPHDQSRSSIASVNAQAAAAKAFCLANNGTAPAGYFVVGDGPIIGNKQ